MQLRQKRFYRHTISPRRGDSDPIPQPSDMTSDEDCVERTSEAVDSKTGFATTSCTSRNNSSMCHGAATSVMADASTTESIGSATEGDAEKTANKGETQATSRKGGATIRQGRARTSFKPPSQHNEKSGIKQAAADIIKHATHDITDWVNALSSQIGSCGNIPISEINNDEITIEETKKTQTDRQKARNNIRSPESIGKPCRSKSATARPEKRVPLKIEGDEISDVLWNGLKLTTNSVFRNLGHWVNDSIINSEGGANKTDSWTSSLFSSEEHPHKSVTRTYSHGSLPSHVRQFQSSDLSNSKRKKINHRLMQSSQPISSSRQICTNGMARENRNQKPPVKTAFTSASLLRSRPMTENIHRPQSYKETPYDLRPFNNQAHFNRQCRRHKTFTDSIPGTRSLSDLPSSRNLSRLSFQSDNQIVDNPPRLPPPPTPDELVRSALMSKCFKSNLWTEPSIHRQPLVLSPPTLWQSLWHSVDSETKKVRLQRSRTELYGECGPSSRQIQTTDVCDSSPLTWRHAWKSHFELTIFSIENVPYIGQVVIDTEGFRLDLPFRVQFVRIPLVHDNQIITIWFNSSYPRPYGRKRSKLLFNRIITDSDDISDESEDDEEDLRDALEDNFITTETVKKSTVKKLPCCNQLEALEYNPQGDWDTYFRFDIPVSAIIQEGGVEDSAIIAPQEIFYHNNKKTLDPQTMFSLLCREAKHRYFDPMIKFCIKFHYQGLKNLVCTGDTFPPHPCSIQFNPSPPISRSPSSMSQANSLKHLQLISPHLFDVQRRLYRPIRQMENFPVHTRPYVKDSR